MNRREFLRLTFSSAAIIALGGVEKILNDTNHLTDNDFVLYVTFCFNLRVSNPSQCAIITGITESDYES